MEKERNVMETIQNLPNVVSELAIRTASNIRTNVEEVAQDIKQVSDKSNEIWDNEFVIQFRERTQEIIGYARQVSDKTGQKASEIWNSDGVVKFRSKSKITMKVACGMRAIEDRKMSVETRKEADKLKADIEQTNEDLRKDMNETLESFGKYRLEALSSTVGKFLHCLELLNQKAKGKEYEFLSEIDIMTEEIKNMEAIDMKASDALRTLAVGGGFAAVGALGTPTLLTTAFTAVYSKVAGVYGAAATNHFLAWLGGGAVASGGGGMAAGTIVLGTIAATAAVGLAVVAVGILASRFYSRKNTEAEAYLADVKIWAEQVQASWTVLAGVKKRIEELHDLTFRLRERSENEMKRLEEIAIEFNPDSEEHVKIFQQCAIIAKSMSELAQTPILDEAGNISKQSGIIAGKTEKILNTEL